MGISFLPVFNLLGASDLITNVERMETLMTKAQFYRNESAILPRNNCYNAKMESGKIVLNLVVFKYEYCKTKTKNNMNPYP